MLLFHTQRPGPLFDARVFQILMGDRKRTAAIVLKEVPISELKTHYAYIYKENNRTKFAREWKVSGTTYYGPGDRINNLTAEEYAICEDLQFRYRNARERVFLELMAAVLYVPVPGKRPVFEKDLLEENARLFAEVPIEKLLAMEMAFFGSKNHLVAKFPTAYPKTEPQTRKAQKKYGFGKVILNMSGGKFGTHNETRRTNIYTFLEEFEENLKQAEHAKHKP